MAMSTYTFKLPDLGEGVVEAEIVAWHVQPGDIVGEDDPLVEVMTDKATVLLPAARAGRVVSLHGRIGETVCVGHVLLELQVEADELAYTSATADGQAEENGRMGVRQAGAASRDRRVAGDPVLVSGTTRDEVDADGVAALEKPQTAQSSGRAEPLASPAVRRHARREGIDLGRVHGSGPGGRITHEDIDRSLSRAPQPSSDAPSEAFDQEGITTIHLSGMRRRMAERLASSHSRIPHFSYFEEVDVTELEELREHLNERRTDEQTRLTYLPFIMLAVARALKEHPQLNAHFKDGQVVTQFDWVHLGVATQTDRGLCVPVVRHVETLSLEEAGAELRRVIQAARSGTIHREELTGSTFTISSLGRYGGLGATPVINPPEVAIFGVHRAEDRPVVRRGQITIRRMLNVSGSFDHRVLDGVDAAAFIQTVKDMLQHPAMIFI
jgi:2-oxoisovalerate dehydrogenase E2 component (dihydrolipoyl transacylase)